MRRFETPQRQFGQIEILDVQFNPKSRDDVPALLMGLQHLYRTRREELRALLDRHILPDANRHVGRPGIDLWKVLVLGALKQGLGCDWDRLQELANEHRTLREMLGHGWLERERYERQNLIDNVSLMTPELLAEVNALLVASGHEVARKKPGAALAARVDSFVVETGVRYPIDLSLLRDATRGLLRNAAAAARASGLGGWRQAEHLERKLERLLQAMIGKGRRTPERARAYLAHCRVLREKAKVSLAGLPERAERGRQAIRRFLGLAETLADQVQRRVLNGERIPHEEKAFSVGKPHTRWISKGKAGRPVELGVPVCVLEDQHRFLLHHLVMWEGEDVHYATRIVKEAQRRYPELRACSFDRGFHSPQNRRELDATLELNALPKKGRWNAADRARETAPAFVAARRAHAAVESAIHHLERCGLDRVRTRGGEDGFARSVALSVMAANLKRMGRLLLARERERQLRDARRRAPARLRLAA